ncbi:hypothetical protein GCM10017643_21040 [Ancylobacter dichloromethanicus]|uniref:Uncharacterized protein n=1 Tax=Ancylobacter dichloromethanicus TaxID=518825 RepID=A0A9W6J937_9HYPH|nr:hypothetical protein GCM10017643_21040 [Ancylobacter dichloromethanicus]
MREARRRESAKRGDPGRRAFCIGELPAGENSRPDEAGGLVPDMTTKAKRRFAGARAWLTGGAPYWRL